MTVNVMLHQVYCFEKQIPQSRCINTCAANSIRKLKLNSFNDFGEQCHTKNSEPYFYESAYLYDNSDSQLDSPIAIPVDTNGICYVARIVDDVSCIDRIEECNDDSESEDDNFDNNNRMLP